MSEEIKRVILTTNEGEKIEGVIEARSPIGVVIKAKGSSKSSLIETSNIKSIEDAGTAPRNLKSKSLPQVSEGKFRQHLVERHGYPLSQVNPLTEDEAKAFHADIDHKDLGHFHKAVTEIAKEIDALVEAGVEVDDDDEDLIEDDEVEDDVAAL